jgi:hypothetical protein
VKARVSKNLKGTLSLPSVSAQAFKKNDEFELSADQYWRPDVQAAVHKRFIVITAGEPKKIPEVEIVKIGAGSVTLPVLKKVLRDDKPFRVKAELLEHLEFKKLFKAKLIDIVGRSSKAEKTPKVEAREEKVARRIEDVPEAAQKKGENGLVWDAGAIADHEQSVEEGEAKKATRKKGKKAAPKKAANDSLIIDTDAPAEADSDDIQWVDIEENEQRIKNHPILGRKRNLDL